MREKEKMNSQEKDDKELDALITRQADGKKGCLFSDEEIRKVVKNFIEAYLMGNVFIKFKSATEFVKEAQIEGKHLNVKKAIDMELQGKKPFLDLISICTGAKKAESDEINSALGELFDYIVLFRSANRIKDNVMGLNLEKRIGTLEKDLEETNALVKEILVYLKNLRPK
jgi:hypothetical protein